MKRSNHALLALSFAFMAISANVKAQADTNQSTHDITVSIPEVALVDIEPTASKNLTMGFTAPTEAGLPIVPASTNNTLWLNYSSIKSVADVTRTISVKLGAVIQGVDIKVTAAAATGAGGGLLGTPASQLTLTATPQTIISGIGSAYTGDGASNGHNLSYSVVSATGVNYQDLSATATTTATVTYTISDN
jgi:hypothetical protein